MKKEYLFSLAVGILLIVMVGVILIFKGKTERSRSADAEGFNLLVITLDTMRADRIGAYGCQAAETPNIDNLAKNGIVFENCYTPVPLTLPSHCSIFTGRYPIAHKVRDNGTFFLENREVTLAEKMKEMGYQTYGVIASYVLLSKFGLKQGFDFYDDSLNIDEMEVSFNSEIKADMVYAKFHRWFKKRNKKKKFFAWVHLYDPHAPYKPPEEYLDKFGHHLEGGYNGEVAYMDKYIGKMIDELKTEGLMDNTLIILTGDHGEAFGEHNEMGHSIFCYEESLRIPLIFYNPGLFPKGLRVNNRVNLIDIMPTILDLYGEETPEDIQGTSFVQLLFKGKKEKERTFYIESMHGKEENGWAPLTGIIDDNYKYISLPEPELYDLEKDKGEKNNLFRKKNRLARTLDKKLKNIVTRYSKGESGAQRKLSEDDKKHLESLGYISAFANTNTNSNKSDTNIDPKKGILLDRQYSEIKKRIEAGDIDQAEASLKSLAEKNPEMLLPQYFGLLNDIYKKKGYKEKVINNWKKAVEKFPGNKNIRLILATEFFHRNHLEESEKIADEIIHQEKKSTAAFILKGKIAEKRDFNEEAVKYFEKALNLEPNNISLRIRYTTLLGKTKRIREAREICKELLRDESVSSHAGLKSQIGIILTEIHEDDLAFQVLNETLSNDQKNAKGFNYLGILYFRKKNFEKSLEAYLKSIELDPKAAITFNNLGTLYLTRFLKSREKKDHGRALDAYNKALAIDPNLVSALNGRASAYKFGNRIHEAITDWKKALEVKPGFTDAYFNLGITYLQLRSHQEALKYFKICKEKFFDRLSSRDQTRLKNLLAEAGAGG